MALPARIAELAPVASPVEALRFRRCTFRRLGRVSANGGLGYEASCLYPDRRVPLPLGDLETCMEICGVCKASHTFRPDED
jgi:hypothetical protein